MARPMVRDIRFDFRGGLNTTFAEDLLDARELRRAENVRLTTYGALTTRPGSRRIHDTALEGGAPILGLAQWDSPGGKQVVAVAGGKLHHKLEAATDFATVASPALSTTKPTIILPYRSGASIVLYLASEGLFKWDGTTLAAVADAPAGVEFIELYKQRGFVHAGTKTLYFSKVQNLDTWSIPDGGFEDVETFDTEPLEALAGIGSSLLLCKADTIARFTGVDKTLIRIDTQTEGVAPNLGVVGRRAVTRLDDLLLVITDRGPYLANEAAVQEIGQKVEATFDAIPGADRPNILAAFHRAAREAWIIGPGGPLVWAQRPQAWTGPWPLPFTVRSVAPYERPDGIDTLLAGGTDGFVRELDTGTRDDRLRAGTGGVAIPTRITLPPLLFGVPDEVKTLRQVDVQAEIPAGGTLTVGWSSELGSGEETLAGKGPGVRSYRARFGARGRRLTLTLREENGVPITVTGILASAYLRQ
ncbi:MAG: hypothetical protein AB7N73_14530 [Gemmatimonadales bacterium]